MATDQQFVLFHEFWTWQYTKRNSTCTGLAHGILSTGKQLVESNLIRNASDVAVANTDHAALLLREPSIEESKLIDHATFIADLLLEESGYCLDEIINNNPTSTTIVKEIFDFSFIRSNLPDNLKYQFRDYGVKQRLLINNDNACSWGDIDRWKHFYDYIGCGLIIVDLETPDAVLVREILATVNVLRQIKNKKSLISDGELSKLCTEIVSTDSRSVRIVHGNDFENVRSKWEFLEMSLHKMCGESALSCKISGFDSEDIILSVECSCGTCASSEKCEYGITNQFATAKQFIKSIPSASFNPEKSGPRAVGLWLWDYIQSHGGEKKRGVIAEAIRKVKNELGNEIRALGFADSEERVFRGFYHRTAECIEAREVLSFK